MRFFEAIFSKCSMSILQIVDNKIIIKSIVNKETVAEEEERLFQKKRSKGKKD